MTKPKKARPNRRSHLNDFTQDASGAFRYTGVTYRREESLTKPLLFFILSFAVTTLSGIFPFEPMMNTIYVILPFLGEIACAVSLLWFVLRALYHGKAVREYIYRKTIRRIRPFSTALCVFAALGCVGCVVHLCVFQTKYALFAVIFFACRLVSPLLACLASRMTQSVEWETIQPAKPRSVLDD